MTFRVSLAVPRSELLSQLEEPRKPYSEARASSSAFIVVMWEPMTAISESSMPIGPLERAARWKTMMEEAAGVEPKVPSALGICAENLEVMTPAM